MTATNVLLVVIGASAPALALIVRKMWRRPAPVRVAAKRRY